MFKKHIFQSWLTYTLLQNCVSDFDPCCYGHIILNQKSEFWMLEMFNLHDCVTLY